MAARSITVHLRMATRSESARAASYSERTPQVEKRPLPVSAVPGSSFWTAIVKWKTTYWPAKRLSAAAPRMNVVLGLARYAFLALLLFFVLYVILLIRKDVE